MIGSRNMTTNKIELIGDYLDSLFPDPKCELVYHKDYELLIAVSLSAQVTDKKVNAVTAILFDKYDTLDKLLNAKIEDIEDIIRPLGSYRKKAEYVHEIAYRLLKDFDGKVPNNWDALQTIKGVGRKTANVVLSNLYDFPAIAVDTHVDRLSKRWGLAQEKDSVLVVEQKLMKKYPKKTWSRRHHQMVLYGRYYCKAIKPLCATCKLQTICKYIKEQNKK